MKLNPLHLIDFYKVSHKDQYPQGTSLVFTNGTFRGSRIEDIDHVIFFGLQYIIKEYLINQFNEGFFKKDKLVVLEEYRRRTLGSLGIGAPSLDHIGSLHDLGYLPIEILALPEGSRVPLKVAPFVMFNTEHEFFWLVNYLETLISASLWQACTSATLAYEYKKQFLIDAEKTTGIWPHPFVDFQGHDFSFRGMSSVESAMLSGAGHLLSFQDTDTVPAIDFLESYYYAEGSVGFSIPATEHSVMCMHGKEGELETFKYLLDLYPKGPFAAVADSWDFWKVLTEYLPALKESILSRYGKLVVRPDSGDPVDIICGTKTRTDIIRSQYLTLDNYKTYLGDAAYDHLECGQGYYQDVWNTIAEIEGKLYEVHVTAEIGSKWMDRGDKLYYVESISSVEIVELEQTPQMKGAIEILYEIFGGNINAAGYKELDPHIGLIYGDSITRERAREINRRLEAKGFASTNWVAGIGSYTYQYNTRDTFGFAMKATYGELDFVIPGEEEFDVRRFEAREIFKNPVTDSGVKKSAKGLIAVYQVDGELVQRDQVKWDEVRSCAYQTVFKDGKLFRNYTLEGVRERIQQNLQYERTQKKA